MPPSKTAHDGFDALFGLCATAACRFSPPDWISIDRAPWCWHAVYRRATFILLRKLGVVGSSPILNVEPVAALAMAWLWLGQSISMIQVLGALLVVGAVMALGLRRH